VHIRGKMIAKTSMSLIIVAENGNGVAGSMAEWATPQLWILGESRLPRANPPLTPKGGTDANRMR
jgi:hypothetical protein